MPARFDATHPGAAGQRRVGGRDIAPRRAVVGRDLQVAVVGAGPDDGPVERGLGDGEDGAVVLRRGVVDREPARLLLPQLARIVGGQVGRQTLPRLAPVGRTVQVLRADVEPAGARRHRRVPVEPQPGLARRRQRLDVLAVSRAQVQPVQVSSLPLEVDDVGVVRIAHRGEAVAAAQVLPVAVLDAAGRFARPAPGAVVLQAAVDPVRLRVVHADAVELRERQPVTQPPLGAAVVGDVDAAVGAGHHVRGVARVDPQGVVVGVDPPADRFPARPRVPAHPARGPGLVDAVGVPGIGDQEAEIERAILDGPAVAGARPGGAHVVRAVEAGVRRLDDGVDPVRARRRDGDRDAAQFAGRQAGGEFLPGRAAVEAAVQPAARSAGREEIRAAPELPRRGEQDVGRPRHQDHVRASRGLVDGQDLLPRRAAVGGLEEAALRVRAPEVAQSRHVHGVRIQGIDDDLADALGILEAHPLPRLAAVRAAVDAVPHRDAVAHPRLAGPDPDGVGTRLVDGDGADRGAVVVEDRLEGDAAVLRFPDPAGGRSDVEDPRIGSHGVDRRDPAAHHRRPDRARTQRAEDGGIDDDSLVVPVEELPAK